jgi:hypothetical protein
VFMSGAHWSACACLQQGKQHLYRTGAPDKAAADEAWPQVRCRYLLAGTVFLQAHAQQRTVKCWLVAGECAACRSMSMQACRQLCQQTDKSTQALQLPKRSTTTCPCGAEEATCCSSLCCTVLCSSCHGCH